MAKLNQQRDVKNAKDKIHWLFQAAAWAAIISAVIAALTFLGQSKGDPVADPTRSQLSIGEGGSPTDGHTRPTAAGGLHVGMCLSGTSAEPTPVSCQVHHNTEVFASPGNCSKITLIAYLGGNSTVDILRNDLAIHEGAGDYCLVVFPSPLIFDTSAQGALGGQHSAVLRQCFNEVTNILIDCQEKHTAEVVAVVEKSNTELVDCKDKASIYLNKNADDLRNQLTVKKQNIDEGFRCLIEANNSNQLTETLRMLGTSSVPISPY
ncbi:hypothetical protein IV500_20415 [Paeniglutamicibacter antarcticus]|uniref:Uncharacterized protein n=1 Tax=Arthrobacter terrae TaxID=2935737 RepID=A0A931CUN7_9MICC|nr:hypothetical protein [Arthrobacter terrae]MBG0741724.1 hypothetical protein [Arthrobacter terrae]